MLISLLNVCLKTISLGVTIDMLSFFPALALGKAMLPHIHITQIHTLTGKDLAKTRQTLFYGLSDLRILHVDHDRDLFTLCLNLDLHRAELCRVQPDLG